MTARRTRRTKTGRNELLQSGRSDRARPGGHVRDKRRSRFTWRSDYRRWRQAELRCLNELGANLTARGFPCVHVHTVPFAEARQQLVGRSHAASWRTRWLSCSRLDVSKRSLPLRQHHSIAFGNRDAPSKRRRLPGAASSEPNENQ